MASQPAEQLSNRVVSLSLQTTSLICQLLQGCKGFPKQSFEAIIQERRDTANKKPRQDKTWNNYKYKRVQIWGYVNGWKGEGIIKSAGLAREPILHPPSFSPADAQNSLFSASWSFMTVITVRVCFWLKDLWDLYKLGLICYLIVLIFHPLFNIHKENFISVGSLANQIP